MQERHPVRAPRQRGLVISYNALGAVLGALTVAGIAILILWQTNVIFKGSKASGSSTIPAIHFQYPKSWGTIPRSGWAKIGAGSNAAAVLERRGNTANLVVLRGGKATVNNQTAQAINDRLKARYSDYKFISARRIVLPNIAKPAMFFTYGRTSQGVLHTITIIPAPPISFIVETASPPGNKAISKEIGKILNSASLTYPKK